MTGRGTALALCYAASVASLPHSVRYMLLCPCAKTENKGVRKLVLHHSTRRIRSRLNNQVACAEHAGNNTEAVQQPGGGEGLPAWRQPGGAGGPVGPAARHCGRLRGPGGDYRTTAVVRLGA